MKNQALFSSKDKSKELKCRLLQFLFCALRVKVVLTQQQVLQQLVFMHKYQCDMLLTGMFYRIQNHVLTGPLTCW